jgi:hypothetical protein
MNAPRINLIVIRSLDPRRTVAFYKMLGMDFHEEYHGNGPVHWAAVLNRLVPKANLMGIAGGCAGFGWEICGTGAI